MAKKHSKRYRQALEGFDRNEHLSLEQAVEQLLKMPQAKFDETVELYARLGVDPKQSAQMVRGTVSLPNGSGKKVRVAVFTAEPQVALDAGADHAGLDDLIEKVLEGWMDFDVAIATPAAMKDVRKVARVLGPRGLMPNPKSGTVTDDIPAAIKEVQAGRVEFKMDKTANIAIIVGKRSFTKDALQQNAETVIQSLNQARPEAFKGGRFLKSLALSSTMSPGIRIDVQPFATLQH